MEGINTAKWLDKFFRRKPDNTQQALSLSGITPWFSQFGNNIYDSDVVQQALKCIVDEIKKLKPAHIRYVNSDPRRVYDDVQAVLNDPNDMMTTSEFLEKVTWLLLLNYNVFIIPTYYTWRDDKTGEERRKYEALYPIYPQSVDFIRDANTYKMYVTFTFWNGYTTTVPYDDVIHIRYNYSVNEFMGGNMMGQPDHGPLLDTLKMNHELLQGIAKAMKASYAVNAVVKIYAMAGAQEAKKAMEELENKLRNNESGFLPLDMKADIIPFEKKPLVVDEGTLKFIDEKILRNWGVSLPILTGDYNKQQYQAFYQKCLEPLIIAYSQAFTKKMFTRNERAYGNVIELYPKDLVFYSQEQIIHMIEIMSPTGGMTENEKRAALGLMPLPELNGVRVQSLNWILSKYANKYQAGEGADNVEDIVEDKVDEVV